MSASLATHDGSSPLLRVTNDDLACPETEAGDRNSMTTDHTDPAGLFSLKDPQHSKPPQDDLVPSQMQAGEPDLDAHGLPVQNQPAKGRTVPEAISWLIAIALLIFGAVGAGIAITYGVSHHKLASHLVGLGNAASWLAGILTFVVPIWAWTAEKNKHKKAIVSIILVGGFLGVTGIVILTGPPN